MSDVFIKFKCVYFPSVLLGVYSCIFCDTLKAQESINAGGGDIVEANLAIAYSLGQVFFEPVVYTNVSVTPGIQQSYEIASAVGLPPVAAELKLQVYPNPAKDYLELSFPAYNTAKYTMTLIDQSGKNLYIEEIKKEISRMEVSALASGVYFLQIKDNERIIKVFKTVKK
jgi:hypothetical protein